MSARSTVAVVLLAACGSKAPAAVEPAREVSAVELQRRAAGMKTISRTSAASDAQESRQRRAIIWVPPRPAFDPNAYLPDPTHVLRWPLAASSHPELVPQFAIAAALAEPGLDWMELCRLGVHRRSAPKLRDQTTYLRAWCAVADHDVDAALGGFASLTRSVIGGLAPAVREDIVNVLVNHGGADDATRLLSKHQIRDLEVLDLLAATYLDVSKLEDATTINEVAILRDDVSRGNRCRRQARRVVMNPEPYRPDVNSGRRLFDEPVHADRTCDRIVAELACWLRPKRDCAPYFDTRGIDVRTQYLIQAHESWPTVQANGFAWLWTADFAINAGTVGALMTSRCSRSRPRSAAKSAMTTSGRRSGGAHAGCSR